MGNKPPIQKNVKKVYVGDRLDVRCSDGVWRAAEVVNVVNVKGSEGVTVLIDTTMEIVQLDFNNRAHVSRLAGEGKHSAPRRDEEEGPGSAGNGVGDDAAEGAAGKAGSLLSSSPVDVPSAELSRTKSSISMSLANSAPLLSMGLEDVLDSPTLRPFFLVYVEAHFDRDDLHFLLEARTFTKMVKAACRGPGARAAMRDLCIAKARAIAVRFVQLDTLDTVELTLSTRNELLGQVRRVDKLPGLSIIFHAAIAEVSRRVREGAFRSFLRSREYRWMLKTDAVARYHGEVEQRRMLSSSSPLPASSSSSVSVGRSSAANAAPSRTRVEAKQEAPGTADDDSDSDDDDDDTDDDEEETSSEEEETTTDEDEETTDSD